MSSLSRKFILIAAGIGFLGVGAFVLRHYADGWHAALSPKYWSDRASGEDMYVAKGHLFKRGPRDRHVVGLTFDDGPHAASCASIQRILREHGVHATFFLVGEKISERPDLARLIVDDGNEVGNHTEDHPRLDLMTADQIRQELNGCQNAFHRATGGHMTLLRPPGMRCSPKVLQVAESMGYTTVSWNVGAKDYMGHVDPDLIASRILNKVQNGAIILLHDNPDTALALPKILDGLQADGYEIVTASQLLADVPEAAKVAAAEVAAHRPLALGPKRSARSN